MNKASDRAASEAGLTLIEAVIALLVTVVGVVSIAGIFTLAMRTNASSRNFTTATTFAQDKLEQLGTLSFARLVDPDRLYPNPESKSSDDAFIAGSLEEDVQGADGSYFYDYIILALKNDVVEEGTVTFLYPGGQAETRYPDGRVSSANPFPEGRVSYSRRWVIMSSNEADPSDRRLTLAVRVTSQLAGASTAPELVDLYTVISSQ